MVKRILDVLLGLGLGLLMGLGIAFPMLAGNLLNQPSYHLDYFAAKPAHNPIDQKLGEVSTKIDLNNSNVLTFRRYSGMYPTLARKIIQNSPFSAVEDVLNIPDLSEAEKTLLKANLKNFIVTPPEPALIEGEDRINPGIYK
ncbi:photosystem II complex extrinsic protein PsbU [Phormidium sp. FACHB-1136]|uniref:photosystem II complex extrinsic protein PsbU n=1 Tax=Phormidium sp. FACHB-1136 TaxID=2692848 RepID=UPI0016820A9A|nr:photosystem II complex extrinsic protein PsbU [Phormidium sp. FACHB-1136]MBD2428149.1 photosystem II complex extrinsic protein PsbU [Phormidium sp. FACHB-1136]